MLSVYSLCVFGAVPLGNLHAGLGVQFLDPRAVIIYSGIATAMMGVVSFVASRAARALD